jgi:DNA-binding NarL/FixJ family response regulator
MFATDNNVTEGVGFYLCCRIKHKNGNYIKVLRQSNVIQTDENGSIISNFSLLTDMSFLNLSNKVEWRFECPGLDKEKFRKYVVKEYKGFFSARELEIISELKQGLKSEQIARKLHISKHTVDTHRRKVLKKASCKNTVELLNFCFQNVLL